MHEMLEMLQILLRGACGKSRCGQVTAWKRVEVSGAGPKLGRAAPQHDGIIHFA